MAAQPLYPTKVCTKCGVEKADNLKEFRDARPGKTGATCRECYNARRRLSEAELKRSCRCCGKKFIPNSNSQFFCKPACMRKIKYERSGKESSRRWERENIERVRERSRALYWSNPEKRRKYSADWARNNRDRYLEARRQWRKDNPDKARDGERRRRARRRGAEGSHSLQEFYDLCRLREYRCMYCKEQFSQSDLTEDHMMPISRGGSDYIQNITPACRSCNSGKGAKTAGEYLVQIGRFGISS